MRRLAVNFLAATVAAAVLTAGAMAKGSGLELSSTPAGKGPGEPWLTSLVLVGGTSEMVAQAKPGITIRNQKTNEEIDYPARPTDTEGVYTARVVFPEAGVWDYAAYDGVTGRSYPFPPVTIEAPAAAPPTSSGASASANDAFPIWPVVGGGLAFLLALGGAAFFVRQRRLGLSH